MESVAEPVNFDFDAMFGDDYLYFYEQFFTPENNAYEAEDVIRFLELEPGMRVLDVPCGHGRIASILHRRGIKVTGVDASEVFLERARGTDPDIDYRRGDLRDLPVEGPFDAVACWLTSFGYFDDDENRQVLDEFRRVLRPGGTLVIETQNRDEFVRNLTPAPFCRPVRVGDDVLIDSTDFDCVTGRMETERVVIRDGVTRRFRYSVRLPTVGEFRVWLTAAGFTNLRFLARDGERPSITRPRLVVLAEAA